MCPTTDKLSQSSNCPIDCVVGPWSSYSSCVNGTMTHTRSITTSPAYGGQVCPPLTEGSNCPVDCTTSAWSTCSITCGGGTQTRTVVQPAMNGGLACSVLSQPCNTAPCPVNCVGSWGNFGGCSAACGGGTQTQTYTLSTPAAYGGAACPATNGATRAQSCNTQGCPSPMAGMWYYGNLRFYVTGTTGNVRGNLYYFNSGQVILSGVTVNDLGSSQYGINSWDPSTSEFGVFTITSRTSGLWGRN